MEEKKSMNSHKCAWWMESPSGFSKDGNGNLRTPPPHNLYALPAWAQKRLFLANLSSSPSPKWWVRFSVPKFPAKPDTQVSIIHFSSINSESNCFILHSSSLFGSQISNSSPELFPYTLTWEAKETLTFFPHYKKLHNKIIWKCNLERDSNTFILLLLWK